MRKEEQIKETLKKLIETLPLDEISVQKLCKESGIKRQTFYYHFSSIYDVLVSYFLNEEIEGINSAKDWPSLIHLILEYAGKNRQLILKTLKSDAKEAIESFFYNNLYKVGRKLIEAKYSDFLNKNDMEDVAKLMSDALSRDMARLLSKHYELSIPAIEENISKTFDGVLELMCENKKQKKKK